MNYSSCMSDANVNKFKALTRRMKKPSKQMFWAWITYQTIKGTLTTSLIWVPLIIAWFKMS